jgi:hypothetical protein
VPEFELRPVAISSGPEKSLNEKILTGGRLIMPPEKQMHPKHSI